ncbi:SDR family oxidoreductase [Microscilla marina]|nr:SDR family oxidoreductase [Microscilla marina]
MDIKDARILITGGSAGIGKATAKMLANAGAKVLITGRDEKKLQNVAQELGVMYVAANVALPADIDKTFDMVNNQLGGLDVLINNAGIGEFPTLEELSLEDFQRVYNVNVFGLALMTQKAAHLFKEQNSGNIINIASTAATKGFERGTIYASSKFALRGMTECWQAELRRYNVRVILVNPSEVPTAFAQPDRKEREDVPHKLTSDEIAQAIKGALEMDSRGFIKELTVIATNPWLAEGN